ncbi:sensor domain-containing protein [Mycobacterium sp. TNTM28]|uniref:Sensor domain-containing protein n=1 Tax=[Mycobacterium] fortunisiensis TaxID=2600579 RepID=A0ABS6KQD2_9MYCO|nr:sensor domain-containing protein [[Mycobacterium] fortunisiensis]MBU9765683.1 sensor domain-containing protein [[Mycobacterium] fortunisiensis]
MRRLTTVIAASVLCAAAAGCGGAEEKPAAQTPDRPMITSFAPAPLLDRALPKLLLAPEQIDAVMGIAGMTVTSTRSDLPDDSATMQPRECLALDGAAQALVYADSGFTAVRDVSLKNGDDFTHYAHQAVVLYPDAEKAKAFFDASAQQWTQCHSYSHTQSGTQWEVGPIANKGGMLSVVNTQLEARAGGWACGRALAVRNNVIVDVNTCSAKPADSATAIADQIATRVESPSAR